VVELKLTECKSKDFFKLLKHYTTVDHENFVIYFRKTQDLNGWNGPAAGVNCDC
jgi:hypothetical protein